MPTRWASTGYKFGWRVEGVSWPLLLLKRRNGDCLCWVVALWNTPTSIITWFVLTLLDISYIVTCLPLLDFSYTTASLPLCDFSYTTASLSLRDFTYTTASLPLWDFSYTTASLPFLHFSYTTACLPLLDFSCTIASSLYHPYNTLLLLPFLGFNCTVIGLPFLNISCAIRYLPFLDINDYTVTCLLFPGVTYTIVHSFYYSLNNHLFTFTMEVRSDSPQLDVQSVFQCPCSACPKPSVNLATQFEQHKQVYFTILGFQLQITCSLTYP